MTDQKQRAYSEWLVICYQQGDRASFDALCRLWEKRFLLYAIRRLENPDTSRDVTQETLISISKGLRNLSDPAAFPGWAFRILERRCADQLRSMVRERQVFADGQHVPDGASTDNTENEISVQKLLHDLDSRVKVVLQLHYLDGFSVNEIAQILEVPPGTIKSRLFYARRLLERKARRKNTEK